MTRVATILVLFAMAVTAVSAAVILNVRFGVPASLAFSVGVSTLLAFALIHVQMMRRRDRRWMEGRIAEISAVAGDVNAEVDRMAAKLARIDGALPVRIREETEPLATEVEVLGHLMKQIAETLSDLEISVDRRIADVTAKAEAPRLAPPPVPEPARAREPVLVAPRSERIADPFFDSLDEVPAEAPFVRPEAHVEPPAEPKPAIAETPREPTAFEREIEAAIRAERIELHLQPMVTLPQRKVRYYEVLSRLRAADGRLIAAAEFLPVAERRRLVARLDTIEVIRSFQILKRLTARNREIGVVVNISAQSLADTAFFREFSGFLSQNRAAADLVQFEFTQGAIREMGPLETESLAAIAALGFRFSMDNVTDLRIDVRGLVDGGFRTVKVSADRLLGRTPMPAGDIHPADLSDHLQRQGIQLVVDRIESEGQVIDLLDYDVRLAQGFLFSAPRQVRPEILGTAQAQAAPAELAPIRANLR